MNAPVDLDAIFGPADVVAADYAVRRTRATRNGYYLARHLREGRSVTPAVVALIEDICNGKLKAPIRDPGPIVPPPTIEDRKRIESLIADAAKRLRAGDSAVIAVASKLRLRVNRPTEAAVTLVAHFYGCSPRRIREIRNPQPGRAKARPRGT